MKQVFTAYGRLEAGRIVSPGRMTFRLPPHLTCGSALAVGLVSALLLCGGRATAQTSVGDGLFLNGASSILQAPGITGSGGAIMVEAWVKPSNLTASCEQVVVQQGVSPSIWVPNDFVLKFWACGTMLYFSCRVATEIGYGEMVLTAPINPDDFMDGNWHHIAAFYEANSLRNIYRDGALIGSFFSGGTYPPAILGTNLTFGASFDGTNANSFFAGGIDEVRIWTVERDPCASLNQPLTGKESGLAGYWRMNEGQGATTSDSSGHDLTARLVDGPAWIPSRALQAVPVVTTDSATNLTATSAFLSGTASVCGLATSGSFQYGPTASYGQSTPLQNAQSGGFAQMVTNLTPDTVYHFRARAVNPGGEAEGADQQFKTAGPPKLNTLPVTGLSPTTATLEATVDPNGLATTAWFEWGTNTDYGSIGSRQQLSDTNSIVTITQSITGLRVGQTYHCRVVATNTSGLSLGQDQTFVTTLFSITFSGCAAFNGSLAWGDYDRNGFLDLLATGGQYTNSNTCLFQNNGGQFSLIPNTSYSPGSAGLPAIEYGTAVWGDFDNDGAVEVVMAGYSFYPFVFTTTGLCQMFHNAGGQFTNLPPSFLGVGRSCIAVGDYNNDGFLDFMVAGTTGGYYDPASPTNVLYRNNGDGTFTDAKAGLPAVFDGAAAWGDFDNDGQLDLAITGNTGTNYITRIYRNDRGSFADIGANLPGVCCGSVAWGDFDNDGQLDLLLVGQTNADPNSAICRVYRNDHGTFTDIEAGLSGVAVRAAACGDYDGDGYLDVVLSGQDATRVYRNEHGVFTDIHSSVPGTSSSSVAWGDYDNDGNLDFAMFDVWGGVQVYRNFQIHTATNLFVPTPPTLLTSSVESNGVVLNWHAGTEPNTPAAGLTYNLRVGSTPGGVEIMAAQSDPLTGRRRLPQMGNGGHRLFATVTNLPVGVYYWSVQTVNNSFAGSVWAPEETFLVTNGPPVVTTTPATSVLCCSGVLNGWVIPGGFETLAWFEWGTTTNLGNSTSILDFGTGELPAVAQLSLGGLQPRTVYFFRLAATNAAGGAFGTIQTFTTAQPAPTATTLGSSNVSNTSAILLGTSPLNNPAADYFIDWGPTLQYGNRIPATILNSALAFDGIGGMVGVGWGKFAAVSNNFTVELWAKPNLARALTPESVGGGAAFGGQQYAIFPDQGGIAYGDGTQAGVGLSIGTNGVSVVEHSDWYMPTVLVHTGSLSGWIHVAIVYSNHVPLLYLNGVLARAGLISAQAVHPSADFGGTTNQAYGQYNGAIQEVRIWDQALDGATLQAWKDREVTPDHPAFDHLQGYWPMNEGYGPVVADRAAHNNAGRLVSGAFWTGGRAASSLTFAVDLIGLVPGTTYHFRAVASNSGGVSYGADELLITSPLPQVTSVQPHAGPVYELRFVGVPGKSYSIEASTNLVDWLTLSNTVAGPGGLFEFVDTSATNMPSRFYRLQAR